MIETDDIFELFVAEADRPFSGWDFSHIADTGRMVSEPLTWSYTSKILAHFRTAGSVLDMGTGGGEYLALLQPFPDRLCATEGYQLNVSIARTRLEPLGVSVVQVEDVNHLPFDDGQFDLIMTSTRSIPRLRCFACCVPAADSSPNKSAVQTT